MRLTRILLILAGIALGVLGVLSLVPALPRREDLVTFAVWFLGPPVLSDAVLMPAVAVIGWATARFLPAWLRTPALTAVLLSAALIAVGLPFFGRPGLRPDNPSLLDRNYLGGTLAYLALVWLATAGWALLRRRRSRSLPVDVPSRRGSR